MLPTQLIIFLNELSSRFGGGNGFSRSSSSGSGRSSSSGSSSHFSSGGGSHTSSGGGSHYSSYGSSGGGYVDSGSGDGQAPHFLGALLVLACVGVVFYLRGTLRKQEGSLLAPGGRIWLVGLGVLNFVCLLLGLGFVTFVLSFVVAFVADLLGWNNSGGASSRSDSEGRAETESSGDRPETALEARVKNAWPRLQKAWELQDLGSVRSFLSDGMQSRTQAQLDCLAKRGIRNRLDNALMLSARECETVEGTVFTSTTVKIDAAGIDMEIDLKTGAEHRSAESSTFTEYWTFLKRTGTQAPATGLMEGICPSCGAPLEMSASVVCGSCKSHVKSGQFDWVLTEISQEGAWTSRDHDTWDLEEELAETDPGFSAHALEDHASMLFWKLAQSAAARKVKLSLPVHAELREGLEKLWTDPVFGPGCHLEPVVGSVETSRLLRQDSIDQLKVEFTWQLGPRTSPAAGNQSFGDPSATRKSFYVFERAAGTRTPDQQNLTTGHCQSCGGPEGPDSAENCPWCGSPKPWGDGAWILRTIESGCGKLGL